LTSTRPSANFFPGGYDLLLAPFGDGERIAAIVALCPNERASNASVWHSYLVLAKDDDMRDFRDAKVMAHTVRAALAAKGLKITNSRSLELIAEAFGVADWNTLAATIREAMLVARKNASRPSLWPAESNPVVPSSAEFTGTIRRAFVNANQRKHEYATLEHLLLALIDDADASAAMRVCDADVGALKENLIGYLDNELKRLVIDNGKDSKPTAAFQRVVQRAGLQAKGLGNLVVTGANILVAIFAETESLAVRLLGERGMSRQDAENFASHGADKGPRGRGPAAS
jgi:hypothetical protein